MPLARLKILFAFIFSISFGKTSLAQVNIDSLIKILPKLRDKPRVLTLTDISFEYAFSDPDKCFEYAEKALVLAKKTRNDTLIGEAYNSVAIAYLVKQNTDSSLSFNFKALKIREKLKDKKGQASSLSKIANIYNDRGKFLEAVKIHQRILPIYDNDADRLNYVKTLNNIVNTYITIKDFKRSLGYSKQALVYVHEVDDMTKAKLYGNIGNIYQRLRKNDSSLHYSKMALDIFEKLGSRTDIAAIANNIGMVYRFQGDSLTALDYYKKAYAISVITGNKFDIAYYGCNMGAALNALKRPDEAIKYFMDSEKTAIETSSLLLQRMVYEGLSRAYEKKGDNEKALYYNKLFIRTKDLILNEEKAKAFEEMEARFQNEKQLKINQELELKRARAESESANKTKYLVIISALSIILLMTVYFFYQRRQRRLKDEYNAKLIQEKEAGLKAVIQATEEERKRIAKDLHDSVGQQMTGLKMAWQQLSGDINKENPGHFHQLVKITQVLDDASADVRSISHQMMPKVLMEMGLVPAVDDMLKKSLGSTNIEYEFEHIGIQGRYTEEIEISLFRICQELINNIIKHSNATKATIQLTGSKNYVVLIVEDNGTGMKIDRNDGIGMMNIKSRVNVIHGDINYESGSNAGTVATVRIPL
ncbi:MAG TPA: sensor histidine kinase [Flavobacteriales bacterium]|nr:sensor histidine kinase [Flavobacteriales bacterium]